ncbi:tyrosine-type recombinase/integrase [Alkalihalobacillus sp. BA299]|uniref:tyrosine-type recombinase/integrase n=1 Tax=Alkalihalobacillus sp. BA299 TaxID=2815938 RepID=UPI001ADBFCAF|nr:tyrosine-type recombinase/integrase [Alkalihalobacillus sp. BA299]
MSLIISSSNLQRDTKDFEKIISKLDSNKTEVINKLSKNNRFEELQYEKEENEKEGYPSFQWFSDIELIYYFVHRPKDTDEKKNRNRDTRKDYIRELLQFYKRINEFSDEIRSDVNDYQETSLFKLLRKRHIRRYQEWLKNAPLGRNGGKYSAATLSWKTVVIKSFLIWLYREGYLNEDVTLDLASTNLREWDRPNRELSYDQVSQLLDYYKSHTINYALLSVLATTGARVAEIANSKFSDLYYDAYNGKYWLKVIGKGNKPRELLIFNNVFERIIAFRKRRGLNTVLNHTDHSPLFTTNKMKPYSPKYLSNYITDIIEKTNVIKHSGKIGPHHFRHYFAIYSAQNGADIFRIQQTLGHESIETTKVYLERYMKKENNVALLWDESKF